jgi:hypothetical protein
VGERRVRDHQLTAPVESLVRIVYDGAQHRAVSDACENSFGAILVNVRDGVRFDDDRLARRNELSERIPRGEPNLSASSPKRRSASRTAP